MLKEGRIFLTGFIIFLLLLLGIAFIISSQEPAEAEGHRFVYDPHGRNTYVVTDTYTGVSYLYFDGGLTPLLGSDNINLVSSGN